MTPKSTPEERDSLGLVEDSAALLRSAPARSWATYLAGAAPYGLGLIWFWLENTRGAFARQQLGYTAGALALLFVWKQVMESLFIAQLRALAGGKPPGAGVAGVISIAIKQAAVQSSSFAVLPLALAATIPLPYVVLFYRQFSLAVADREPAPFRHALETARFGPRSLWMLTAIASLGGILLYANLMAAVIVAGQLASSFFGIENLETGVMALLSNTTVHFTIGVAVYSCLDLLFASAAALQAFRAVSVRSGDDLLAALKRGPIAALVLCSLLLPGAPAHAQETNPQETQALERAIAQTLERPEFAWRLEPTPAEQPSFIRTLARLFRPAADWMEEMIKALGRWLQPDRPKEEERPDSGGAPLAQYWLVALALLAAIALAFVLLQNRKQAPNAASPSAAAAPVDLTDESLLASTLPEDEWLRLADRHALEGAPRLALRALHLAGLRALSGWGWIAVRGSKTGSEYVEEVRRRTRQQPAIAAAFNDNVRLFELGWYSSHPVSAEMVNAYRTKLEEIRSHAR